MSEQQQTSVSDSHFTGNFLGIFSILIWGSVIAFSRSLAEDLGTFTSGACIFLLGGAIATSHFILKHKGLRKLFEHPPRHLLICGSLFILYEVAFYTAIGHAHNRQQVIEIGLINYLWISFTLVFSIPILKKKASPWLVPGILLSLVSIAMTAAQGGNYSLAELKSNVMQHGMPYLLAFAAAVAWALYSNLNRSLAGNSHASVVPFFLIGTGLVLAVFTLFVREHSVWNRSVVMQLLYTAVFPITLGYVFWDIAMRRGNLVLVTSLSYAIPIVSTIISGIFLGVALTATIWVACVLVIAGGAICRFSIKD